jgi:hypothetical protein
VVGRRRWGRRAEVRGAWRADKGGSLRAPEGFDFKVQGSGFSIKI